jgi:signal transduction histidine kinase
MGESPGEKRILAGWAHDLGKPLQVIGTYGRRLSRAAGSDRRMRDLALAIVALSDDALRVVDHLMDAARPDESRADRLDETLARVIAVVRGLHPGCVLSIRGPIPVLEIGRSSRLFSALVNLADNAIRASQRRQAVTIQARVGGDELVIEVIDRGSGMSDHVRLRAFQPYFSTRQNTHPTGLGLSECRIQIESMGGRVEIESIEEFGTRASVVLPTHAIS